MQTRGANIFARRLIIGWILSSLIVLINISDTGTLRFIFSDASIAFFTLGTGPMIAICSSWYQLLPLHRRTTAIILTIISVYSLGLMAFRIDVSHRIELDALITLFVIAPQLLLLGLCVTFFGIKDALLIKKHESRCSS